MKLGKCVISAAADTDETIGWLVRNKIPAGEDLLRVEIHSLDPEPWPTERPEGWGVGCWCQVEICRPQDTVVATVMVFDLSRTLLRWLDTQTGETGVCAIHSVKSFGPRAEWPKGGEE